MLLCLFSTGKIHNETKWKHQLETGVNLLILLYIPQWPQPFALYSFSRWGNMNPFKIHTQLEVTRQLNLNHGQILTTFNKKIVYFQLKDHHNRKEAESQNQKQLLKQKQSPTGVPMKRCTENMQQTYRRTPILKCDFNEGAM